MSGAGALDYRAAGVDIDAADDAKHRLAKLVQSTLTAGARGAFGGFGGMFRVPEGFRAPLLCPVAYEANRRLDTDRDGVACERRR